MIGCGCKYGHDCGCHGLAGLTPDQATEQIFPQARVKAGAGHNAATRGVILSSAQAGEMLGARGELAYIPGSPDCSAVGSGGMVKPALLSTVSGLALKFAPQAFAAGPIVGGIVVAIGALTGAFSAIFGHHAAAIKKEQSVLCAAVPAANHALQIIDEAVQSGQATPQDGINALSALPSQFEGEVGGIIHGSDPTSPGECNAACVMLSELRAIVLVKQSEYQDLLAGAAQTVTPARPNVTSPAGSSVPASSYASFYAERGSAASAPSTNDWLPIAALVVAGFFFLRSA